MTDKKHKELCLALMHADSEDEVIQILKMAGYWDDPKVWRLYGDTDQNFPTIGNQQSRSDAALAEKIVNSVDARLLNECLKSGIDPESDKAPQSIRHAIGKFFEKREIVAENHGTLREWTGKQRLDESKYITIAVTGAKKDPCITIADQGEGQAPNKMPSTFLSIHKNNKLRIPFVQGKYNQGGTGALVFCGKNRIQLIITRRNPSIISAMKEVDDSSECWGFTVVRRERATQEVGAVRNSVYTYLAPIGTDRSPKEGGVLRFNSDTLQLMPINNIPYAKEVKWGSLIKLYNYDMKGFSSHILMPDGLLNRLEILLPGIALPVSLHECRDYRGKKDASFVTPMSGLFVRLEDGKGGNLEDSFPKTIPFSVDGEEMLLKIYAFLKGKADKYRTNEGVIFINNGQTQGAIPKTIFSRKKVKMHRLADSLICSVDCSNISVGAREDLFMTSRDRLSSRSLRSSIEKQIEDIIASHPSLRSLRERRRKQEIEERLEESKPLQDVIKSILKSSPSLAALFLQGRRLGSPYKRGGGSGEKEKDGNGEKQLELKKHPTYFKFHNKYQGETFERNAEIGRICRVKFDTDVEDDYFQRSSMPGHFSVLVASEGKEDIEIDNNCILYQGLANWSLTIPDELAVGEIITLKCIVSDDVIIDDFTNILKLKISPKTSGGNGKGSRSKRKTGSSNNDEDRPWGIELPPIEKVREDKWNDYGFNKDSAMKVVEDVVEINGKEETQYTFYINVDNIYLQSDMKESESHSALDEAKFIYGNVLIGLALLKDYSEDKTNASQDNDNGITIYDRIFETTRALAPFIVPMIDYLGGLRDEDVASLGEVGDQE